MDLHAKNARNNVFWILCIMGLFAILSSTMSKNPVLQPFATSLETPEGFWMGFVASASTIPGILISLPAASLSDIFGRRKVLLTSSIVFASAPFLYLLINSWWQLILVRFYHGFATAVFVPVAEASVAERFPAKRGERISLFSSATYLGRGTAPFLGAYILQVTNSGFHTLYLAVAVAGVTALVMTLLFLTEKKQTTTVKKEDGRATFRKLFRGWGTVVGNYSVLIVSFVQSSQFYVYGVVEFYLTGYLRDIVHLDYIPIGFIIGSIIVMPILAKPYMGRVSDKIGRRIPIALGCIVSGLPLLAIPFVTDFSILLLFSVVYGLGFATVTASTPALVSELVPNELVGTAMGFVATIMDVGQTIGPIISGIILGTSLQYSGVFPALTLVLLFSCVIFVLSGVAKTSLNDYAQQHK